MSKQVAWNWLLSCKVRKDNTLDLCRLHRPNSWSHKALMPHREFWQLTLNHLLASYGLHHINRKTTPCLITQILFLPYFIIKFTIKCRPASKLNSSDVSVLLSCNNEWHEWHKYCTMIAFSVFHIVYEFCFDRIPTQIPWCLMTPYRKKTFIGI